MLSAILFPLQLGESNSLFLVLGAVILAVVIVIVLLTMMKRASAMSDEISKESKAKFEAITPTKPPLRNSPLEERKELPGALVRTNKTEEGGYLMLRKDLMDTRFQLERYIRENTLRIEKIQETGIEIEKLTAEVHGLQDRLNSGGQESQKLKTIISEQTLLLHNQRQDIETVRSQLEKVLERAEIEKLSTDIRTALDRLLTTEEELQKIRTKLEEQNTNLTQVRDMQIQTRMLETTRSPQMILPNNAETPGPRFPQTPTNLAPKACLTCGSPLQPGDRFCFHCGQRSF